ncbi:hypothetical protein FE840_018720 (plasmid) [Peteryoungia desertarenae]|uniref:Glycosyl hydrolase family 32 N-terminal domain-containing protein n=1 Tax=Peteryoungia desertarenae TaxID=1813451 RepID=A0ABX6QSQ1_9HYPH|nr:hypothetical protein [Peteryoungia desertarenae]QLF71681.1 hypothetical protein FE840_018720 [Peteryoungia desertarenae]
MKFYWRKLGKIFCPSGSIEWMHSHASVPIAERLNGNIFKIYFSSRDKNNRSYTGYIIIDITRPKEILAVSSSPVIGPGSLGEFDDSGAMATWIAQHGEQRFLYYIGWNLGVTVPFRNSIGLCISEHDGDFRRYAAGPIIDRSVTEPHFVASCCVLPDQDKWRMWYLSCTDWRLLNGRLEHRYHIKYAESVNGISWNREGIVAIDYADDTEYAISRPSVIRDPDCWKMWFSCRGSTYRIGYAESQNGIKWNRLDADCAIDVSLSGWDSEMIEYPFVFDHDGARYMLYNGNGYGQTGFGLAVLEVLS